MNTRFLKTPGFTLIEILLVIALATAVTATGTLGLSQLQAIFRLRSAADEIRIMLQLGRELTIANQDQETYQVSHSNGITTLQSSTAEISRYQSPPGIIFSPPSFTWGFTPITGQLTGCSLPCQINLTLGNNAQVITIQPNGLTN